MNSMAVKRVISNSSNNAPFKNVQSCGFATLPHRLITTKRQFINKLQLLTPTVFSAPIGTMAAITNIVCSDEWGVGK